MSPPPGRPPAGPVSCLPRPARGVTGLAAVGAAPIWSGPDHDMHPAGSHAMALPPITVRNRNSVFPATDRYMDSYCISRHWGIHLTGAGQP
jgi:hypothetical protein